MQKSCDVATFLGRPEPKRGAVVPQKGKTRITIYIDDDIIEEFRSRSEKSGKGYQTMINEAL